jgi:hypothetical protein
MRRMALKIWTRRDTARCGRCFKALFGKPFGPGALLTLRPPMAARIYSIDADIILEKRDDREPIRAEIS